MTALAIALVAVACQSDPTPAGEKQAPSAQPSVTAAPAAKAPAAAPRAARQDPLEGPPTATLVVSQAQFFDQVGPDGKASPVPGPAKLTIVRNVGGTWKTTVLEDPDSNVFHKTMPWNGGLLSIGGNKAMLKTWKFSGGKWTQETHWNPVFGGKFDRLRDVERGDLDHDGKDELVIATHDQGVIAIVHPEDGWRVEQVDRQANTFVHEIEIGDVDGDGKMEFFATPSKPNKLDQEQPGEVTMYKSSPQGWQKSIVDAPGDTHAKEILTADVDKDGISELYIVWEGAIGPGGNLVRPVTIKQYRMKNGAWTSSEVASIPDRQMRAIAAGDVDGDGKLEIYVGSEDQGELRRYRFENGAFSKTVIAPLTKGDISWNINDAKL